MSTINDMMQAAVENGAPVAPVDVPATVEGKAQAQEGPKLNFGFLTVKTGPGSLESRINHPLNYNGSLAMARIIRGLEGFFNDLGLAIIDVIVGLLELRGIKKAGGIKANMPPVDVGGLAQVEYKVPES